MQCDSTTMDSMIGYFYFVIILYVCLRMPIYVDVIVNKQIYQGIWPPLKDESFIYHNCKFSLHIQMIIG